MKLKENTGYKVFLVVNTIIMILISVATLFPFVYLVAQSLSSEKEIISGNVTLIPKGFNLKTYIYVITEGEFIKYYKNTILYTVVGTLRCTSAAA